MPGLLPTGSASNSRIGKRGMRANGRRRRRTEVDPRNLAVWNIVALVRADRRSISPTSPSVAYGPPLVETVSCHLALALRKNRTAVCRVYEPNSLGFLLWCSLDHVRYVQRRMARIRP